MAVGSRAIAAAHREDVSKEVVSIWKPSRRNKGWVHSCSWLYRTRQALAYPERIFSVGVAFVALGGLVNRRAAGQPNRHRRFRQVSVNCIKASQTSSETVFHLRSVGGLTCEPGAIAQIECQGKRPEGASIAAVSAAGLKGRGQSINQDCIATCCDSKGNWLCIVVDGHGEDGHRCAEHLCSSVLTLLAPALEREDVPAALKSMFLEAQADLERAADSEGGFDIQRSGGAAVVVALVPEKGLAYFASCGDSQAMLIDAATGRFQASEVHKAHNTKEQQRIVAAGGSIKLGKSYPRIGPFSRVYGPRGGFGLAMSRSFGDLCLKNHGVTAEPSVMTLPLPEEACIAVGSDGLFEFMSPTEVAAILHRRLALEGTDACGASAEALVIEARDRWYQQEAGTYCDDVSCLLLCSSRIAPKDNACRFMAPSLILDGLGPAAARDTPVGMY